MRKHLRGRAFGKHRAFVHHDNTVTAISQVIHTVRDHNNGQALIMKTANEFQEILARRRIESRHGLIKHQDLGLHGEHAGKRHAPLLPARELKGALVAHRSQIEAHTQER